VVSLALLMVVAPARSTVRIHICSWDTSAGAIEDVIVYRWINGELTWVDALPDWYVSDLVSDCDWTPDSIAPIPGVQYWIETLGGISGTVATIPGEASGHSSWDVYVSWPNTTAYAKVLSGNSGLCEFTLEWRRGDSASVPGALLVSSTVPAGQQRGYAVPRPIADDDIVLVRQNGDGSRVTNTFAKSDFTWSPLPTGGATPTVLNNAGTCGTNGFTNGVSGTGSGTGTETDTNILTTLKGMSNEWVAMTNWGLHQAILYNTLDGVLSNDAYLGTTEANGRFGWMLGGSLGSSNWARNYNPNTTAGASPLTFAIGSFSLDLDPGHNATLSGLASAIKSFISWFVVIYLYMMNYRCWEVAQRTAWTVPQATTAGTTIAGTNISGASAVATAGLIVSILSAVPTLIAGLSTDLDAYLGGGGPEVALLANTSGKIGWYLLCFWIPFPTIITAIVSHIGWRQLVNYLFNLICTGVKFAVGA